MLRWIKFNVSNVFNVSNAATKQFGEQFLPAISAVPHRTALFPIHMLNEPAWDNFDLS